jgi:three-Cys-motif partner protein
MARKEYGWEVGGAPPPIQAHSLAKHRILRDYVERYIHVLTARRGMDVFRLTLVDGFAGGGEYVNAETKLSSPGSPLILIDAVRAAEAAVNVTRTKRVRIDANFIFVDEKPKVLAYLNDVLTKRGDAPKTNGVIRLLPGTFESNLDAIIKQVASRGEAHRVIFVLDQYGYTHVPVATLSRIFRRLPNAEVFLTLAVGWITAYLPNARVAAERLGITADVLERLKNEGTEALNVDDPDRRPDLLAVQRLLHHAFTEEAGSQFYTPFFIVSRKSNRPYWFLHMANSQKANDVVKALHWDLGNNFQHFGSEGLLMLGYDPDSDPNVTKQLAFTFDSEAERRTRSKLLVQLPARIVEHHPSGVPFGDLFRSLCNETPATRKHLAKAIRELCQEGELEKQGAKGERREPTTLPHDGDIVRGARQRKFTFR